MTRFYITTAIPYANAEPHVGHLFELLGADVVARAKRMIGYDVYFQTGTDEHGQKMLEYADKAGKPPKEYADSISPRFDELWRDFHISHDHFIRSTDPGHARAVEAFWRAVRDNGDIYPGKYEGLYCVPDETFVLEAQAVISPDGKKLCPECGRELTLSAEETYFFRWSKYTDAVRQWIADHPEFIQPSFRANEMINTFLKPGLQDISISRTTIKWGIPVPGDEKHVVYVWFDALINYITGVGYGSDNEKFGEWWPADLHVVGKDILKFHTLLWPAMCMSAGIPVPKRVFGHGFVSPKSDPATLKLKESITYKILNVDTATGHEGVQVDVFDDGKKIGTVKSNGFVAETIFEAIAEQLGAQALQLEKMSKSKGNVVSPRHLLEVFGGNPDPIRYFLMREIDYGQDGIFSEEAMVGRYNAELADKLGNLVSRTLTMVEKYQNGIVTVPGAYTEEDDAVRDTLMSLFQRGHLPTGKASDAVDTTTLYERMIDECNFNFLLERIWTGIARLNAYITEQKPFTLAKDPKNMDRLAAVLYVLCEGIRVSATMIYPFVPSTAEKIWKQLGITEPIGEAPFEKTRHWGYIKETRVTRGENLFPKAEEAGKK